MEKQAPLSYKSLQKKNTHTLPQPLPSSLSHVRFSSLPHTHAHTRPSLSGREEGSRRDGKKKEKEKKKEEISHARKPKHQRSALHVRWSWASLIPGVATVPKRPFSWKRQREQTRQWWARCISPPFGDEVSATGPRRRAKTSGQRHSRIEFNGGVTEEGNGEKGWKHEEKHNKLKKNRLEKMKQFLNFYRQTGNHRKILWARSHGGTPACEQMLNHLTAKFYLTDLFSFRQRSNASLFYLSLPSRCSDTWAAGR